MKMYAKILQTAVIFCLIFAGMCATTQASALPPALDDEPKRTPVPNNAYFSSETVTTRDGTKLEKYIIGGPPHPPAGHDLEQSVVTLPEPSQGMAMRSLSVPAYDWVFGCSAVSGAMIAGYHDRSGFPLLYTGPTNSGVMPIDSSVWPGWIDSVEYPYPNNPLVASHNGLDGRDTPGSIDDYWVEYNSGAPDPYITAERSSHTWGDAIGDFMKTSQSAYGNPDGSTTFYNFSSGPLTCSAMEVIEYAEGRIVATRDGTYGRKMFYEAKGYTVTDCYNQRTDNVSGGFTFAMYKAEIDAGRPVLLNLYGHSVVGVGYNDTGNTVYLHNTWDYDTHQMTWGGSYLDMMLLSVSIVNIAVPPPPLPGDFRKIDPEDGAAGLPSNPTLSWESSSDATSYEYCLNTSAACPEEIWTNANGSTSVELSDLTSAAPYFWQVRARNSTGVTAADSGAWASFSVVHPTPTITSFSPAAGIEGTSVQLTGTNFTGTTAVQFNGLSASFTVESATSIQTTVPSGAASGPISVVTAAGTASTSTDFEVFSIVQMSVLENAAAEGDGTATIRITLAAPSSQTVSVDYATSDNTATAGEDYTSSSGTLTFDPGFTEANIEIPLLADTIHEGDETFILTLTNPVNAYLPDPAEIVCTIIDDDLPMRKVFLPFTRH